MSFFFKPSGGWYSRLLRISSSNLSEDGIQQRRRFDLDFRGVDQFFVEETGKQQPQQILRDGRDGALGRQVFAIQMIDAAQLGVGRDQTGS